MSQITASSTTVPADSPPSRRLTGTRWRDPRLWVGLMLVAASVVVGARLLAASDDTVGVWAVGRDIGEGAPLTPAALVVQRVRFTDPETAGRYLSSADALPDGVVASRDLGAGELLARAAIGAGAGAAFELPVVVGAAGAPEDLGVGDVVDVWVAAESVAGVESTAERVLSAVPVVGTARGSGPLGEAATRQVLLGLDEGAGSGLGDVVSDISTGSVVLVRHGAGR